MEKPMARFEILSLQAQASRFQELDFVVEFTNRGLPQEVITRLQPIFREVRDIAGQTINIGKIIIMKLVEFVKQNPNMSIGIAVGIGLSALAGMITSAIPFIGQWLSPLVSAVVALIAIPIGALRGHRLDKVINGEVKSDSIIEDLITIAKKFWALFVDIFYAIKNEISEKKYV